MYLLLAIASRLQVALWGENIHMDYFYFYDYFLCFCHSHGIEDSLKILHTTE